MAAGRVSAPTPALFKVNHVVIQWLECGHKAVHLSPRSSCKTLPSPSKETPYPLAVTPLLPEPLASTHLFLSSDSPLPHVSHKRAPTLSTCNFFHSFPPNIPSKVYVPPPAPSSTDTIVSIVGGRYLQDPRSLAQGLTHCSCLADVRRQPAAQAQVRPCGLEDSTCHWSLSSQGRG